MSRIRGLAASQRRCRCSPIARYKFKSWAAAAAVCCIFCSTTTTTCVRAMKMSSIFLEADVRDGWDTLLDEGSKLEGGPGEIVGAMLEACHGRGRSGGWSAECDRALYLQSVLEKVGSTAALFQRSVEREDEQQLGLGSATREIAVVPSAHLPFSAFFLEYAVPRRPVIISGEAGGGDEAMAAVPGARAAAAAAADNKDILGGKDQQDLRSHRHLVDSDENASWKQRTLLGDKGLMDSVAACLPYPVDSTADTVEGPLRACGSSVLDSLPIPLQVTEDFAQRFRSEDVLPLVEHPDVERFLSGWQSLHRTRRGSNARASACPSGANALVVAISGTLEVLVYAAEDLPHLRPTYGNAPCPRSSPNFVDDGDQSGADYLGEWSTREEHVDAPLSSDGQALGSEGKDAGNGPDESLEEPPTKDDVGTGAGEPTKPEKATERRKLGTWPHEPMFCASVWPTGDRGGDDNSTAEALPPRTNARDLSVGDALFVPSGAAVAWRAKGVEEEAMAVRFCYVDASNFASVKTQLPIYAAVEAGARGLLRAFSSPVFDTSMSRRPSVVSAADFLTGNRHTPMSVLTSSSSSSSSSFSSAFTPGYSAAASHNNLDENPKAEADLGVEGVSGRRRLSAEGSMASGATTSGLPHDDLTLEGSSSSSSMSTSTSDPEPGRKGARGRRGRKSFKEWQDDSRWDLKVLGLTLPTLEAPRVKSCERTSCTVEWTSSFVKRGQDQTKLGFNLSFVPVAVNASIAAVSGDGGGYMEVYVGDSKLNSEHALDRELLSLGITEGKKHTVVVNGDLSPDTLYRFSVCVVYGETVGPFSEQSKPARTGEITPPLPLATAPEGTPRTHAVTLHFRAPRDDGGARVSSYHVMSRPTGGNVLGKWQAVGMAEAPAPRQSISVHDTDVGAVSVTVDNLVPGVAYQFRVCAQNYIGTSPWSAPSDPVVVLGAAASDTGFLSGFHTGHQHLRLPNVTDASVSYAGATEPPPGEGFDPFEREVHGPTIVLDDSAGKVGVNDSTSGNVDVWTCHFSPQSFRVKAEVVVAQPADADRELENGRFVRNRVVMVQRGSTPIVRKVLNAQRAGALGVLIADDGRCNGAFGQLCVHGSDPPEGWAAHDQPRLWNEVLVPVVLILKEDAERLMAEVGIAAAEAESMAWSSLYDGWQA